MTQALPLSASLCLDQRQRWQHGESVRVEIYLERFPTLRSNPDSLLDLIYNEIVLREESGEQPRLEEYLHRFGQFEPQIRQLFEVHQALEQTPDEATDTLQVFTDALRDDMAAPPGYEILGELGRGGMGVVYRARQMSLNRLVALKMILAPEHAGPHQAARFRAEAEAVARLQHPNIVQVHEVGDHDGRPFFSMELVEGATLADRIDGHPQPASEAAGLVEVLARAVQHAHSRGVVHRDLKPANVLLLSGGERLNAAGPKITDFGLAKRLDGPAAHTQTGTILGSPSYMAPEQTGRSRREVGPAADVYALGAVLYELLTGRPPFRAETPFDTLLQVVHDDPLPPSRLRPRLPRDLETICLKCLEKEPQRRYPTAEALAEDLRRFLDGKPVVARPLSPVGRGVRWARRRPAVAALVAVGFLILAGLPSLAVWSNIRENRRLAAAHADVGQTLDDARDDAAREQWDLAHSHVANALDRIDAEPSLAPLRPRAEQLLAEIEARAYAANAWSRFTQARDDALFHRLEFLSLGDVGDREARLAAAGVSAREALAVLRLDPDGEGTWEPDPRFDVAQRAQLKIDGATLLLVVVDEHAEHGRHAEALRALDRAGRTGPASPVLVRRRAAYLRALGDKAGASEAERQAEELKPATAWDYFLLGDEAYRHGDLTGATHAFESAVGLDPRDFWSEFLLARCHADAKAWEKASACLTTCLVVRPSVVWTHLLRGYAHREMGALVAAEADFATAESLLKDRDEAPSFSLHLHRGLLRLRQGRYDDAVTETTAAASLRPDDWAPHLNLARIHELAQHKGEAENELRRVLERHPPPFVLAEYHALRGRDLYESGRYEEAAVACRTALREREDYPLALGFLGQALLGLGRYEEAARAFTLYLDKGGPVVPDIFRGRGQARMKLGDYLGARDDYTRVVLDQPSAEIYEYRGWAYFFADAWQPALRDFDEALRRDAGRGDAYTGRGLARVMLGRYREAVSDADEALRRKPSAPEMMHNLACIFAQAAARAEADSASDRLTLAARYRERAVGAVRSTLALVPAPQQTAFLRSSVVPDRALDPIRQVPAFRELLKEHQLDQAPR
jgi:serine/threonine protein kinase/tetratricopeptide (TPR) repeat protein